MFWVRDSIELASRIAARLQPRLCGEEVMLPVVLGLVGAQAAYDLYKAVHLPAPAPGRLQPRLSAHDRNSVSYDVSAAATAMETTDLSAGNTHSPTHRSAARSWGDETFTLINNYIILTTRWYIGRRTGFSAMLSAIHYAFQENSI